MSGLEYRKALPDEAERIFYIVQHTKDVIYPDYYARSFDDCELDASLPACVFYENRGYKTVKHIKYEIGDGKFMIYEIMKKRRTKNE